MKPPQNSSALAHLTSPPQGAVNLSESSSGSGSSGSDSESSSSSQPSPVKPSRRPGQSVSAAAAKNPELYGVRRSGRAPAVRPSSSSDEGSSDGAKGRKRKPGSSQSSRSEDSEEEWSDEEVKPKKPTKKKPPPKKAPGGGKRKKRSLSEESEDGGWRTSRNTRGAGAEARGKVDYVVPDTDEDVDEDTVQSWTFEEEEPDNSPTVEKVLEVREGAVGATGPATTAYSVEAAGDPNTRGGAREQQFLIKWKGYSHLHNTWESDASLAAHTAKGLKKVENFVKRQEEVNDWKTVSSPEDVEYMECQLQMQQELQASYTTVDRWVVWCGVEWCAVE